MSGLGGDRGLSFYNAAKGAVSNLTRSLALEFGAKGIRINAVCPTITFTELNTPIFERFPELLRRQLERIPINVPVYVLFGTGVVSSQPPGTPTKP